MNNGLQPIRVTIPAGDEKDFNVAAGRFFCVKEASAGSLEVSLDDGAFLPWDAGMSYQVADTQDPFKRLKFRNRSANPIEVVGIVGTGRVYDQRFTVIASRVSDSLALDGTDATGVGAPAGAVGIRGWLSGIFDRLKATGPIGALITALSAQLPAALDGGRLKIARNALGVQANAWAAAVVGAGGVSAALDTLDAPNVSMFGSVNAATTLTAQVSQDSATWFDTGSTSVLAGAGNFHFSLQTGAKYVRLKSSGAATITATIAAK